MRQPWILFAIWCVPVVGAQTPSDVTLTLATRDGRTQFRQGEAIPLELHFESSTPGKYGAWQLERERLSRRAEYDQFSVEPTTGAVDVMADSLAPMVLPLAIGQPPKPTTIEAGGANVELFLNEWISFRKPGKYRVRSETTRLVALTAPQARLSITSASLEIEITPFDAAWADAELKRAVAVLEIPDPKPGRIGQRGPSFEEIKAAQESSENAARTVRLLETPAAARALARYIGQSGIYAQAQLRTGLYATPLRKELIAALNEVAESPDQPIVQDLYIALKGFAETEKLGSPPPAWTPGTDMQRWMREVSMPYRERAKPIDDEVTARMMTCLANKRGEALAISLATLGTGRGTPVPAVSRPLLASLPALPEPDRARWLTSEWWRIAAPEALPILKTLALGEGGTRDPALRRLMEMDPATARPIVLARIAKGDVSREAYHDDRVLLMLPDATLPDLDDVLMVNVERRIVHADWLLARYGSPVLAPRVRAYLDQTRGCSGPMMAYLFRVDAEDAAKRLAQFPASYRCASSELQGKDDLLLSPALEKELIRELDPAATKYPGISSIASLLQNSGSPAAKIPLMQAMTANYDSVPPGAPIDATMAQALLGAAGWVANAADFDAVQAACKSEQCRRQVDRLRTAIKEPVPIMPDTLPTMQSYASVGPFRLSSAQKVRDKIAQFPKGTSFYVEVRGYQGSWYMEQFAHEISAMLTAAGMKLVEPPPLPQR